MFRHQGVSNDFQLLRKIIKGPNKKDPKSRLSEYIIHWDDNNLGSFISQADLLTVVDRNDTQLFAKLKDLWAAYGIHADKNSGRGRKAAQKLPANKTAMTTQIGTKKTSKVLQTSNAHTLAHL